MITGHLTRLRPDGPEDVVSRLDRDESSLHLVVETLDGLTAGRLHVDEIDSRHRSAQLRLNVGVTDASGQGLDRDALAAVCRHLFDQRGLHRLGVTVSADDALAVRVYEQLGFRHEGVLRDAVLIDGSLRDEVILSLLAGELRD